jgi:hypothetical protein
MRARWRTSRRRARPLMARPRGRRQVATPAGGFYAGPGCLTLATWLKRACAPHFQRRATQCRTKKRRASAKVQRKRAASAAPARSAMSAASAAAAGSAMSAGLRPTPAAGGWRRSHNFRLLVSGTTPEGLALSVVVLKHQGNNGRHRTQRELLYYQARERTTFPQRHVWSGWATPRQVVGLVRQKMAQDAGVPLECVRVATTTTAAAACEGGQREGSATDNLLPAPVALPVALPLLVLDHEPSSLTSGVRDVPRVPDTTLEGETVDGPPAAALALPGGPLCITCPGLDWGCRLLACAADIGGDGGAPSVAPLAPLAVLADAAAADAFRVAASWR